MNPEAITDATASVVASVLGLEGERAELDASSPLLGEIPELDSMAIVQLVLAIEDRFGIEIDGDEITGDVFETVGSLAAFVAPQIP